MDKLGKIRRHYWKLKLVKLPNLTVIRLKREKTKLRKVAKIYRHLYVGEQVSALHYTNVCKISRLWGAVSSLVFNKSLSNLANLLILRHSFQWCRRIFPNLSMSKVEKKKTAKRSKRSIRRCDEDIWIDSTLKSVLSGFTQTQNAPVEVQL